MRRVAGVQVEQQSAGIRPGVRHGGPFVVPSNLARARRGENQVHRQTHRPRSASHSSHFRHGVRTLAGVRISNAVRISVAAASLVVAAGAAGCSDTVDGGRSASAAARPAGLPNPTPPTTSTPSGPTLDPSERLRLHPDQVRPDPLPTQHGVGGLRGAVRESAGTQRRTRQRCRGDRRRQRALAGRQPRRHPGHHAGLLHLPRGGVDDQATNDGTRFTNDGTGHGMFVSIEKVEIF